MYASRDNLITRFGAAALASLAQRDLRDDIPVSLDDALRDAHNEIDSYLRARYALPITTTSTSLQRCTLDLAFYNLHEERCTELVEKRRDDWIKWLKDVARGALHLDVVIATPQDGAAVPVVEGGLVEFSPVRPTVCGKPY